MYCPKCGSENTTRVPIELLDGVKGLWYGLIVMSLFGMSISPVFLLFCAYRYCSDTECNKENCP